VKLPTLPEVRKALGALGVMEAAAVGYGLIDSATAGFITAGLGVATAGVVWLLNNEKPKTPNPAVPTEGA
jgi:hypothetical protein